VGVERRRENLELLGAVVMLTAEIDENASRLQKPEGGGALTYGVWDHSKPILASRGRRALDLAHWSELNAVYRIVYENRKWGVQPGDDLARRLVAVSKDLKTDAQRFEREITRRRYWLSAGKDRWRGQAGAHIQAP
jgi:hypothetical protein